MKNPAAAVNMLPPDLSALDVQGSFSPAEREAMTANMAMVKLLKGDSAGAAAEIQSVLGYSASSAPQAAEPSPSAPFLRFAAEYFYDFGELPRSAELFSRLPDEAALLRQADALWLAGYAGSARAVWSMLAAPGANGEASAVNAGLSARSLYNLALTAENRDEAAALLEQLVALPRAGAANAPVSGDAGGLSRQYGLIRYSRLLDAPRATAILEAYGDRAGDGAETGPAAPALLELEILRRRTEIAGTGRLAAETWLLLGRYPEMENLYQWGAWFFDHQRNYGETAVLLKTAARREFNGQWIAMHEALQQLRNGNPDGAENLLVSVSAGTAEWAAAANLGRILESRHAPARALEFYEIAAAALQGKSAGAAEWGDWDQTGELRRRERASRIQFRIAQCLKTLGRAGESRRALEYALDFNPDNLNARLELGRLGVY
jgi:hypothetical protein